MQPCGGGTRIREGALVSTIIRVSSRRMSFINARGKLRPYTCIYTRVRREGEREGTVRRGCRERVRRGRWRRGRGKTTEAKYPSFCFVLGGWVLSLCAFPFPLPPLLPRPLARSSIIIIFYHNICFSHILFYVNGRSPSLYPLRQPSPLAAPVPPPTAVASYAWPRGTFSILSRI